MKIRIALAVLACLAFSGLSRAEILTGNVEITGGEADAAEYTDGSHFEIYGPNFFVNDYSPFVFRSGFLYQGHGGLGVGDGYLDCGAETGEYMGVEAACFGPIALPLDPGFQPAWYASHFSFTPVGIGTTDANGDEISQFTASGEIVGFTPVSCARVTPTACTELWDVTFEGQGTMELYQQPGSFPGNFDELYLTFAPPSEAPEAPTAVMFALASLVFLPVLRKRLAS